MRISRKYKNNPPKKFQNIVWSSASSLDSKGNSKAKDSSGIDSNMSSDSILSIEKRINERKI